MSEISNLHGLSDPIAPSVIDNSSRAAKTPKSAVGAASDDATSSSQAQLSKLGSVLSGIQLAATQIRSQVINAANQIKSGSYSLDPLQISRSIVSDHLLRPNIGSIY